MSVSKNRGVDDRMSKRRSSSEGPPDPLRRAGSRRSLRMSTRMKKVAPPPPPPVKAPPPPLSNGSVLGRRTSSGDRQQSKPPLPTTTPGEDCAFDELLEGHMDLEVVLPDLKVVRMTVDRRTPMMDFLVQATTSNKISPSGHIINVISKDERNVNYKPNTPIGSLDASTVYIIPKSTLELPVKRMPKLANQPFEQQTFRLQVNLPLNQRMVLRVSPRITLAELKNQICSEKELDHSSHHLVHPAQPDTILDLNATLEVYGCAEISLMSNSGLRDSIRNTSTNIFPTPKIEEDRKKKGILRIFSRKKKDFTIETTNEPNRIPTSHSENSSLNKNGYQPKQSIKRKPAPAPPPSLARSSSPPLITQSSNSINSRPESEISVKTADEIESTVSHSRHSSDSSGYHEPSVFSDCSENKSPEASIVHGDSVSMNDAIRQHSPLHKDYPDSSVLSLKRSSMTAKETNLKNVPSCSNVSISSASRKRKAPQPPVSTLPAIESPTSPNSPSSEFDAAACPPNTEVAPAGTENGTDRLSLQSHPDSAEKAEESEMTQTITKDAVAKDSTQQESEALQYLEDVLQESEDCVRNFSNQRIMDDSDTDSLKDEGELISVCQAEVHANANDQDSSDSIVEPPTVVTPDPAMPKSSLTPLSAPNSQPEGYEVVDTSADDSGISQSLNSDADSSVPSINSDLKTMSDSGCHEEIYCNVSDSLDAKSVPSGDEFPTQDSTVDSKKIEENSAEDSSPQKSSKDQSINDEAVETTFVKAESTCIEKNDALTVISATSDQQNASLVNMPAKNIEEPIASQVESSSTEQNEETKCDQSDKYSVASSLSTDSAQNSASQTPQFQKKLNNFALGCYRKDESIDIYSAPSPEQKISNGIDNSHIPQKEIEVPVRKNRKQPDVKILSFKDRNQVEVGMPSEDGRSNVSEKCAQLSNMSTLPLTGRSTSLVNLIPQKKLQRTATEMEKMEEEVVNGNMKRTHSDQNMAKESEPVQLKETFLQEQKRLQEEYYRLQEQFISWQKQLLCNQSLLQNEKIIPQMPFPSLEGLSSLDSLSTNVAYEQKEVNEQKQVEQKEGASNVSSDLRTRSLPRPKTKPLSLKEPSRPQTPPLAQSPVETAVVDIDISQEPAKRPESLNACSVDTQATSNVEDKVTQIPSPQDKITQVPSPQEKVTSGTQAPSPENVLNKDTSAQTSDNLQVSSSTDISSNSLSSPESDNSKSQTLPRPKPKPISAFQPSHTMTLNRNSRPKSQVVSVTIGSWQQRQTAASNTEPSSSVVASTRSKFLSLENIPQNTAKSVPSIMEKRKLPPVPTEVESTETLVPQTVPKSVEAKMDMPVSKNEPTSVKSKLTLDGIKSSEDTNKKPSKIITSETKILKTVPKQVDDTTPKQKSEIKLASREPGATLKSAKPFVKLSSMKDEPHPPSIVGLKKWPLSDMNESRPLNEGKQSILEDLKASSKRPGGYVQDKIRRAEVDLRKPKSSKTEPPSASKSSKHEDAEASKLHITKVSVNAKPNVDINATIPKVSNAVSNPGASTTNNTYKSNTIPKSQSLNSELMSVFSKKAAKISEKLKQNDAVMKSAAQTVTVNGSAQSASPPPPPPPPPPQASNSTMPTIPPAEQIPVSSQLLMARGTKTLPATRKDSKKSPAKHSKTVDPREELMLEIRGFGGKQALRKLYEKSCLTLLKKSPKKKTSGESSSSMNKQ